MGNYFFLGGMDHMLAKPGVVGATNKDSIDISTCSCLWDIFNFNWGSYLIAVYEAGLAFCVLLEDIDWDIKFRTFPSLGAWLYAGPAIYLAIMAWIVPVLMNPYVCPCTRPKQKKIKKRDTRSQMARSKAQNARREGADAGKPPPRPHHTRQPHPSNNKQQKQQRPMNGTRQPKRSNGAQPTSLKLSI
jgi:hypothetical protein